VPFDWQVTDTQFIVAHLHYVLVGGVLFPFFAGVYFWLPKMTGRMLDERLGHLNFWLLFIGTNVTFFPLHIAGIAGMPRRVFTYAPSLTLEWTNAIATAGAVIQVAAVLVFIANVIWSMIWGRSAGNDPWGAATLEWATTSPPEPYDFRRIPVVRSATPLWDDRRAADGDIATIPTSDTEREVVATEPLGGDRPVPLTMPGESYTPFATSVALGMVFVGLLFRAWPVSAVGLVALAVAVAWWLWPAEEA
jgi:cytochrome c oxidase subunit 1/cytochrome c oxidase subunit I+III